MSTRGLIGVLNEDGSIRAIYVRSAANPRWTGRTLRDHYPNITKIVELLNLGHLEVLGEEIGEKHDWDFNARRYKRSKKFKYQHTWESVPTPWGPGGKKFTDYYMYPYEEVQRLDKMCLAYARDGENAGYGAPVEGNVLMLSNMETLVNYAKKGTFFFCEYVYLYMSGRWFVWDCGVYPPEWMGVDKAMELEEAEVQANIAAADAERAKAEAQSVEV